MVVSPDVTWPILTPLPHSPDQDSGLGRC